MKDFLRKQKMKINFFHYNFSRESTSLQDEKRQKQGNLLPQKVRVPQFFFNNR